MCTPVHGYIHWLRPRNPLPPFTRVLLVSKIDDISLWPPVFTSCFFLTLSPSACLYGCNQRHWHLWTYAISTLSQPPILLLLFLNHIIVVALWIHLHLGSGDSDVRRRRGASRSCDRGTRTASHWFPWYPSRKDTWKGESQWKSFVSVRRIFVMGGEAV